MAEHHLSIKRSLRYFDNDQPEAENLLMALHGYGQHPQFFVRKFSILNERFYTIAPEGLHRFYVQGHSGRVGASWMTKEDRLVDIADNMAYLKQLYESTKPEKYKKKVLLGFSQGAATAVRFFCAHEGLFDQLILWAGSFPPDLDLPANKEILNHSGIDLVIGDNDEFIHEAHIIELSSLLDQHGVSYRLHRYPGAHDIDSSTLSQLL